MDPVSKLITGWKIPIGQFGKTVFDFIIDYFQWFFDAVSTVLETTVDGASSLLLQIPPVILAVVLAGLAYWLRRSIPLAIGVLVGFLFILNQGLWKETVQTLVLVVSATALSMAIGVPMGIWAAHKPHVWRITQPILDLMQTMPTFVYLIPILILFGLGAAPGSDRYDHLRNARPGAHDVPWPNLDPEAHARSRRKFWSHEASTPVEGRTARGASLHHGRAYAMHHAVAINGGFRNPHRRTQPRKSR